MFEPAIKWSGSKRHIAKDIISYFPKEINTYYEPFCGGASVLRRLLASNIKCNNYVCSDLNQDLINLWNCIKDNPIEVYNHYNTLWTEFNSIKEIEDKKQYFYNIRERLNKEHSPLDFMFIMRTTTNGMPRYNDDGEFNNSLHISRKGIEPNRLLNILIEWSEVLNKYNVEFRCCSYEDIIPDGDDFIYLDPPYAHTKGMYYGSLDYSKFWNYMSNLKCPYILSFDGISGNTDNTYNVPIKLYDKHIYLESGNSSFKRIIGKSNTSIVYESLYLKGIDNLIHSYNEENNLW